MSSTADGAVNDKKWVTRPIVHSELGYQEPFKRLVANYMRVEQRGGHIIQSSVDEVEGCLSYGPGHC